MKQSVKFFLVGFSLVVAFDVLAECPVPGYTLKECLAYQIKHHRLPDQEGEKIFEPLSNSALRKFARDERITKMELSDLVRVAYASGHPLIYTRDDSPEKITSDQYSINLMWLHHDRVTPGGHIFGGSDEQLSEKVISPINNWRSKHADVEINYWYDGRMVDSDAIANTAARLTTSNVIFRDVWDIELVKDNKKVFKKALFTTDQKDNYGPVDRSPIYFRVDLAKALIKDQILKENKQIAIFTDLDVVAISIPHLFDRKTMRDLKDIGLVLGAGPRPNDPNFKSTENSFLILSNFNQDAVQKHRKEMIDFFIDYAKTKEYLHWFSADSQDVYFRYRRSLALSAKPMITTVTRFGNVGCSPEAIASFKKVLDEDRQEARVVRH